MEKIPINKTIYSTNNFKEVIDTNFSELVSFNNEPSIEDFFNMYNELYFVMPIEGDLSHSSLVRKSSQLLTPGEDPKDSQIISLQEIIAGLEEDLFEAQQPPAEHPIFPNGSIIAKEDQSTFPHAFYMDQGYARGIDFSSNAPLYASFYRIKGYTGPSGDNPIPKLSNTIIAGIPKGPSLTAFNMNERFTPSNIYGELEQLRITLDPTDALLDVSRYNGNYVGYKNALEQDYNEKVNLIASLETKATELRNQILNITGQ